MPVVLEILVYREPQLGTKYISVGEKDYRGERNKWRMKCRLKKSGMILAESFQKARILSVRISQFLTTSTKLSHGTLLQCWRVSCEGLSGERVTASFYVDNTTKPGNANAFRKSLWTIFFFFLSKFLRYRGLRKVPTVYCRVFITADIRIGWQVYIKNSGS